MTTPRALVLRAPGINCDRETAHACRLAGFAADLVHINQLIKEPQHLLDYHLLVIPGGFSYGDDLGAGTLLAKNLTIHLGAQLQQFIDEGRLVLGICNGFQALVRAELLPDPATDLGTRFIMPSRLPEPQAQAFQLDDREAVAAQQRFQLSKTQTQSVWESGSLGSRNTDPVSTRASLTNNASAQFECRWITLSILDSPCIFTRGIDHPIQLPVAHGEGQFVLADPQLLLQLQADNQIPIVYTMGTRQASPSPATLSFSSLLPYPDNPNGSTGNIAGICNARGNVFGLMPHPERYVQPIQHPQRRSNQGMGDGLLIFNNAFVFAQNVLLGTGGNTYHSKGGGGVDEGRGPLRSPWEIIGTVGNTYHGKDGSGEEEGSGNLGPLRSPSEISSPITHIPTTYTSSGVNIAAADTAKTLMRDAMRATHGPQVLAGMGAFAGVFQLDDIHHMRQPALVASTDGVGTKTLIAAQARRFDTIGYDLVNHSVNDLLTQGAKPLFFMDYLAMGRLDPVQAAMIVSSVANACREVGCALLGGETAEMPDVYLSGAFDLAGTIVGIVEQEALVNPDTMDPGDIILGFPSSGLHTNGYSLARRVFAPYPLDTVFPELAEPLVDALLRPHRCYLREILTLRVYPGIIIKGMAHITGGGFEGNISRILPPGIQAVIETNAWSVPPIFDLLGRLGNVPRGEMYRALNMGIGMALIVSPEAAIEARRVFPELLTIGHLTEGKGVILL